MAKTIGLDEKSSAALGKEETFVAMDYHLDWLAASVALYDSGDCVDKVFSNQEVDDTKHRLIEGTQEDMDLLVAFESDKVFHLILIEAKAYEGNGFASFDRNQLRSKGNRLRMIVQNESADNDVSRIKTYFYLMSKNHPNPTTDYEWPWDKDNWIQLDLPSLGQRRLVQRFNRASGKPDSKGPDFRIRRVK